MLSGLNVALLTGVAVLLVMYLVRRRTRLTVTRFNACVAEYDHPRQRRVGTAA